MCDLFSLIYLRLYFIISLNFAEFLIFFTKTIKYPSVCLHSGCLPPNEMKPPSSWPGHEMYCLCIVCQPELVHNAVYETITSAEWDFISDSLLSDGVLLRVHITSCARKWKAPSVVSHVLMSPPSISPWPGLTQAGVQLKSLSSQT